MSSVTTLSLRLHFGEKATKQLLVFLVEVHSLLSSFFVFELISNVGGEVQEEGATVEWGCDRRPSQARYQRGHAVCSVKFATGQLYLLVVV